MDYIEVKVTCAGDACELLAEELAELTGGCQIDDPRTLDDFLNAPVKRWDYIEQQLLDNPVREPSLRFFLSADEEGARILEEVRTILTGIKEQDEFGFYGSLEMEVSEAQSQDWENNWKQYYKPFCVGNRLFVCPSWEEAETPAGRTLLTMDPASSFGTGSQAPLRPSDLPLCSRMTRIRAIATRTRATDRMICITSFIFTCLHIQPYSIKCQLTAL